jgi:peptidoglycan hydrolase-like protein with peptidoglycan-binding domain
MSDIIFKLRQGGGKPSDDNVLRLAAARMQCEVAVLQAILEVESNGRAFDDKGRLIILPEKHVFWRELPKNLRNKAKRLGLAVPKWGKANYKGLGGSGSDARWDRLEAMAELEETAGLRSSSYAGPQIMGFNAQLCGYATVQEFVLALAETEAKQIEAFLTYLERVGLLQAIRDRDWRAIARRYNGSGQVARYAGLMKAAYERIANKSGSVGSDSGLLRLGSEGYRVKALQERLVSLGYHVKPDGDFGPATRRQVVSFQADNGLKPDGVVGPRTSDMLDRAIPVKAQPGGTRENLTVKDLRKSGSETIKQADWLTRIGLGVLATGAGAETLETVPGVAGLDTLKGVSDTIQQVAEIARPVLQLIASNKWLALIAIGVAVYLVARKIKLRRLYDAKEWRHVG